MVDTRAKFIAPSTFGDDIVIETRVAAFRNSSFDVEHKVFKPSAGGEQLAIEAWETRVWVGPHPDDPKRLQVAPDPADRDRAALGKARARMTLRRAGTPRPTAADGETGEAAPIANSLDLSALTNIIGYPLRRAQMAVFDDFNKRFAPLAPVAGAIFGAGRDRRQSRPQPVGNRRRAGHPATEFRRDDGRTRAPRPRRARCARTPTAARMRWS